MRNKIRGKTIKYVGYAQYAGGKLKKNKIQQAMGVVRILRGKIKEVL